MMENSQSVSVDDSLANLTLFFNMSRWGQARVEITEAHFLAAKKFKKHLTSISFFATRGYKTPRPGFIVDHLPNKLKVEWFRGLIDSLSHVTKNPKFWKCRVLECAVLGGEFQEGHCSGRELEEQLTSLESVEDSPLRYPECRKNETILVDSIHEFIEAEMKMNPPKRYKNPRARDETTALLAKAVTTAVMDSAYETLWNRSKDKWGKPVIPAVLAEVMKAVGKKTFSKPETLRKLAKVLLVIVADVLNCTHRLSTVDKQAKKIDSEFAAKAHYASLRRNLDCFLETLIPVICHVVLSSIHKNKTIICEREKVNAILEKSSGRVAEIVIGRGVVGDKDITRMTMEDLNDGMMVRAERVDNCYDLISFNCSSNVLDCRSASGDGGTQAVRTFISDEVSCGDRDGFDVMMLGETTRMLNDMTLMETGESQDISILSLMGRSVDAGEDFRDDDEMEEETYEQLQEQAEAVFSVLDDLIDAVFGVKTREEEQFDVSCLDAGQGEPRILTSIPAVDIPAGASGEYLLLFSTPNESIVEGVQLLPRTPFFPDCSDMSIVRSVDKTDDVGSLEDTITEALDPPVQEDQEVSRPELNPIRAELLENFNFLLDEILRKAEEPSGKKVGKTVKRSQKEVLPEVEKDAAWQLYKEKLKKYVSSSPIPQEQGRWERVALNITKLLLNKRYPITAILPLDRRVHLLYVSAKSLLVIPKENPDPQKLNLDIFQAYDLDERHTGPDCPFQIGILCLHGLFNDIGRLWRPNARKFRLDELCAIIVGEENAEATADRIQELGLSAN